MTFKIILIERKQSIQISILEKLAVCFVAFLIPASALAGLIVTRLASLSNRKGLDDHLLCYSTRKASTQHTYSRRPPAYHTYDIFLFHLFLSRIFGPGRSALVTC